MPDLHVTHTSSSRLIEDTYFIEFVDDSNLETEAQIRELAIEIGGESIILTGPVLYCAWKGVELRLTSEQLALFENDPRVASIEQVELFQLPDLGTQTVIQSSSQILGWGADSVGVVPGVTSGVGKRVWVIDSGVDVNHPDLTVDGNLSRSFLTTTTSYDDEYGHGTAVASVLAAKDNNIGIIGVAPGATIISLRIGAANGEASPSAMKAALDYICDKGKSGDVVNISYGININPATPETQIEKAIKKLADVDIFVVCAGGNSGQHANTNSSGRLEYTNVFTVSSYRQHEIIGDPTSTPNFKQGISNFGNPPIDYSEPGRAVPKLQMTSLGGGVVTSGSGATSIAAPHLSGIILMNGKNGIVVTDSINGDVGPGYPDPIGKLQ